MGQNVDGGDDRYVSSSVTVYCLKAERGVQSRVTNYITQGPPLLNQESLQQVGAVAVHLDDDDEVN